MFQPPIRITPSSLELDIMADFETPNGRLGPMNLNQTKEIDFD